MRNIGVKKYTSIIWVVIAALVFSATSFSIATFITSQFWNNNTPYAAFSGSGTQADPYKITSIQKLSEFANNVNNGEHYDNTYFKVTTSIDGFNLETSDNYFSGIGTRGISSSDGVNTFNSQHYFNGHFDGGGNTISNFYINVPKYARMDTTDFPEIMGAQMAGFFACLGPVATVSNLRLKDFTLNIQYKADELFGQMSDPVLYIGGIAGGYISTLEGRSVSITNCSVEGMTVKQISGNTAHTDYVGGIIGGTLSSYFTGGLAISDCYLKNITIDSSVGVNPLQNGGADIAGAIVGNVLDKNPTSISDCILTGTNTSYLSAYANGNYGYGETINTNAKNVYLTTTSNYTLSSVDAGGGSSGTTWYRCSEYNSGIPLLRSFIEWKPITFSSADTTKGTVAPDEIYIPSDAFSSYSTYDAKINKKMSWIYIYEQRVSARSTSGYSFEQWVSSVSSSAVSYTAYFTENYYYYEFENLIINGTTIEPTCSTFVDGKKKIKIALGTDAEVECDHTPTATTITYNIGDHIVTYVIPMIEYTMEKSGVIYEIRSDSSEDEELEEQIEDWSYYHDTYYWGSGHTFVVTAPTLTLKTYNTNFQ